MSEQIAAPEAALFGGPIPYHATAVRPAWLDLPPAVRAAVERHVGATVTAAHSQGGGFTGGFASRLACADGRRVFVKAESALRNQVIADCYAREAVVQAVLPDGVPAPRLRWSTTVDDWVVLGFDDVRGRMPSWDIPGDLDAALTLVQRLADTLTPKPPGIELETITDHFADSFRGWRQLAGGELTVGQLDPWAARNLDRLAALEANWAQAAAGSTMIHCDLRADNILIDESGSALVCDWNWPVLAAPWVDLVCLLIPVQPADADAVLASHPVAHGVPPSAVNALLAALAGFFLLRGDQPAPDFASPWLRPHQRQSGAMTLSWLRSRLAQR